MAGVGEEHWSFNCIKALQGQALHVSPAILGMPSSPDVIMMINDKSRVVHARHMLLSLTRLELTSSKLHAIAVNQEGEDDLPQAGSMMCFVSSC